jgi:DNA-binding XRE family transcriptional regulator
MSVHPKDLPDQFGDEFRPYLEEAKRDPGFRAAFEDADDLHRTLDRLVALRKAKGLSQKEVAERMGVRQPTVSGFETEGSDPRLSTLQRYARAVDARLRLIVVE